MKKLLGYLSLLGFIVCLLCLVAARMDSQTMTSGPGDRYDLLGGGGFVAGILFGLGFLKMASAKRPAPKDQTED